MLGGRVQEGFRAGVLSAGLLPSAQVTASYVLSLVISAFFAIILFKVSSNESPPAGSLHNIVSFTSKCNTNRGRIDFNFFAIAVAMQMCVARCVLPMS